MKNSGRLKTTPEKQLLCKDFKYLNIVTPSNYVTRQ